jgi:cell pole-organizing protein PopZ
MRQAGEPSVEEILESIKKVIARDNRAEAAGRAETAARTRAEPAPRPTPRPAEVLELTEAAADEDELAEEAGLIADAATASMRESLAALSMLAQPGMAPQIVRSGETSLEGLVRELLKPMLADWLEKNLPAMVEKMVSAEIARIAGKRG